MSDTLIIELVGTDDQGDEVSAIPCRLGGALRRDLSFAGDEAVVFVKAADWAATRSGPGAWHVGEGARRWIRIATTDGMATTVLRELKGYVERRAAASLIAPPAAGGAAQTLEYKVTLATFPRFFHDGRGGTIVDGTLNELQPGGLPGDPATTANTITNTEAIEYALAVMGVDHDAVPATVDDAPLVGPLDWGNGRAINELLALLSRTGHAAHPVAAFDNRLRIVRLKKAGETITLPSYITDHALPYELTEGPSVRGTTFMVTSGRTRSLILRTLTMASLEWVAFDDRTGRWLSESEWTTTYSGETGPEDLATFKAGPGQTTDERNAYGRCFRALRVADAADRARMRAILTLPQGAELADGTKIGGVECVAFARHAVEQEGGQWRNDPEDGVAGTARLEGVEVDPDAGVFVFGKPMVKVSGATAGSADNLVALGGSDLLLAFAHEANESDWEIDYFARAYTSDASGVVTPVGTPPDNDGSGPQLVAARDQPTTVHVEAPFLRRVLLWEDGEAEPTPVNDEELSAVAEQFAQIRASSAAASGGLIELRGIQPVEPGDAGGAVTSVEYDVARQRTIITVMEHERPDSEYEALERRAGRSIARGLSRLTLAGSSVAESEVREASSPGGAGAGGSTDQVAAPASRGKRDAQANHHRVGPPNALASYAPPGMRFGRIVSAMQASDNKWDYTVRLGAVADDKSFGDGTTDVAAINLKEINNTSSGVQGCGIDVDTLPANFAIQPIGVGAGVALYGPFGAAGSRFYVFDAVNNADGECS